MTYSELTNTLSTYNYVQLNEALENALEDVRESGKFLSALALNPMATDTALSLAKEVFEYSSFILETTLEVFNTKY
jgi:hypothetical protein